MSKPDHPMVLVNDSGDPDGADKSYPLDQFMEAWGGSGNMYIATDLAPPHLAENSLLGSNFQPDSSGLGGMYMTPEYWATFLKRFGPIIALGWFSSQGQSESTTFKPVTTTNPWESMTPVERNDLFSRI
jgi:acyl-CoA synthetase (AMP-forming)/AMP-acid ligase II